MREPAQLTDDEVDALIDEVLDLLDAYDSAANGAVNEGHDPLQAWAELGLGLEEMIQC